MFAFRNARLAVFMLAAGLAGSLSSIAAWAGAGEATAVAAPAAPDGPAQDVLVEPPAAAQLLELQALPDATTPLAALQPLPPALPGPQLTLEAALRLGLSGNPALAALQQEVQAANARYYQGSIKPNPAFEAEISDFMGNAETRFFRGAVSGFGVSQLIERGRKRCARMSVAQREGQVAEYAIERERLDVMLAVSEAYYTAQVAQQGLALAMQREALVQQVYDTVGLRVQGGKVARLEQSRTGIDLAAARLALEEAERTQRSAMARLASLWGGVPDEYGSVAGELTLPAEAPQLAVLLSALPDTPELRRWAAEEELRRARRDLAQAEGEPDITWSGGLERFEDTDSFGFKVGVSFPLQLRRTTHGKVVEAQAYIDQVDNLRAAEQRELAQQLTALHGEMAAAYARALGIENELLASAAETFELTQVGYRYGKFGLLDVLDAQRTLIDVREQYFDALAAYRLAAVQVERLIAQPLAEAAATAQSSAADPGAAMPDPTNTEPKETGDA